MDTVLVFFGMEFNAPLASMAASTAVESRERIWERASGKSFGSSPLFSRGFVGGNGERVRAFLGYYLRVLLDVCLQIRLYRSLEASSEFQLPSVSI